MEQQVGLMQRVELLENELTGLRRSNRMVKIACGVIAVAFLAFGRIPSASSSGAPKIVTAQQFLLVDSRGSVLANLQNTTSGPLLTMNESNGATTLQLGTFSQSVQFATKGIGLRVFDGNGVLSGNGVPRAAIGLSNTGIGSSYLDTSGTKILSGNGVTPSDSSWGPVVYDANGSARGGVIYDTLDNFVGLFVNDSGANRGFVALALDG